MTTNTWIEYIMRHVQPFLGVYSSDNVIIPTFFPSCCILNFSSEDEKGTHFVTLLYTNKNLCTYFDPLNLGYIPYNIMKFLSINFDNNINYIQFSLQNPLSNFCGLHCMLACMIYIEGFSLLPILKENFIPYSRRNDEKGVSILCKLLLIHVSSKTSCCNNNE